MTSLEKPVRADGETPRDDNPEMTILSNSLAERLRQARAEHGDKPRTKQEIIDDFVQPHVDNITRKLGVLSSPEYQEGTARSTEFTLSDQQIEVAKILGVRVEGDQNDPAAWEKAKTDPRVMGQLANKFRATFMMAQRPDAMGTQAKALAAKVTEVYIATYDQRLAHLEEKRQSMAGKDEDLRFFELQKKAEELQIRLDAYRAGTIELSQVEARDLAIDKISTESQVEHHPYGQNEKEINTASRQKSKLLEVKRAVTE